MGPEPGTSVKTLIVTADDFGASLEVNEAVEQAHRNGILTCASLMVTGAAAADAVARARRLPNLGVGLHLVLVEGVPALPPALVSNLVDGAGHFRTNMVRAGMTMALNQSARRQLAREIDAQFAAFTATGLALDHANAHKHFHLHPVIAALMIKSGHRHGLTAIRAPIEPREILSRIELRSPSFDPARLWARLARRQWGQAGMTSPDQVFGLAWSGAMTRARLLGLLANLPAGTSEIYLHPAMNGGWPGAAPGYDYTGEFAALTDPDVLAAVHGKASGIRLARFADLSPKRLAA